MTIEWRRPYALVGLIGGRWTLVVLAELDAGGLRYQDLHDALDGISPKVLTDAPSATASSGGISIPSEQARQPSTSSPISADRSMSLSARSGGGSTPTGNWSKQLSAIGRAGPGVDRRPVAFRRSAIGTWR